MDRRSKEAERRKRILDHAKTNGNVAKTCRYFGVARPSFYRWRQEYQKHGDPGLISKTTGPKSHPNQTPAAVVDQVLHLRRTYHLGPMRIVWYLARYHDIKISDAGVYRVLKRHGVSRLPGKVGRRAVHTTRYERVPGHHIQLDVKFLSFKAKTGATIKRFQYTAIDDATRIRALKIYNKHNQINAMDFVDYVIEKSPFRIQMIRTDRGHEFQAKFHWHVEDRGIHTSTSSHDRLSSTARSSARTAQIRKSSISFSVTKTMSISKPNWRTGSVSTTAHHNTHVSM